MSKKHRDSNDRKARIEQLKREQAAKERKRKIIIAAITLPLLLLIIAGTAYAVIHANDATKIDGLKTYTNLSRTHVNVTPTYKQSPPVGGDHLPVWQNCGVYTAPIDNGNGVHSLEHGAVWITYKPGLPAAQVAKLAAAAKGRLYVLVSPYPGLPAPVVASAWGKQVYLTGADDDRLAKFIKAYAGGAQAPEVNGLCTQGVGTPVAQ